MSLRATPAFHPNFHLWPLNFIFLARDARFKRLDHPRAGDLSSSFYSSFLFPRSSTEYVIYPTLALRRYGGHGSTDIEGSDETLLAYRPYRLPLPQSMRPTRGVLRSSYSSKLPKQLAAQSPSVRCGYPSSPFTQTFRLSYVTRARTVPPVGLSALGLLRS